ADALVERLSGGQPANLQVTATIETLKGLAGAAAGEMEFSIPISSSSVQRMACDCSVTRVLLSQESVTIDVGRSKRVISGGLSRALKARDGHCRWPGCERSASMCDGHHLVHWIHGGPTDLDNLVLLCRRHHRMVHEGGWQLIKNRRPSDHHHRADGYVRIAARTRLDLDDQRPERVAGDEKAALHKLRRALELAVLVLDGNHPVVADRVERADETVPPDLAQAR